MNWVVMSNAKRSPGEIQLELMRAKSNKRPLPKKIDEIDLALTVMCNVAERDETLNTVDIAVICGCSQSLIAQISRDAINKLRGKTGEKLRDFY